VQEELGDLKLYRIPDPVTGRRQQPEAVAMLEKDNVAVEVRYRQTIHAGRRKSRRRLCACSSPAIRQAEGLGLPLPAGRLVLFGAGARRPILLGEGFVDDRALGEEVEIELGAASGIFARTVSDARAAGCSSSSRTTAAFPRSSKRSSTIATPGSAPRQG
jgi:hypothetical protein